MITLKDHRDVSGFCQTRTVERGRNLHGAGHVPNTRVTPPQVFRGEFLDPQVHEPHFIVAPHKRFRSTEYAQGERR